MYMQWCCVITFILLSRLGLAEVRHRYMSWASEQVLVFCTAFQQCGQVECQFHSYTLLDTCSAQHYLPNLTTLLNVSHLKIPKNWLFLVRYDKNLRRVSEQVNLQTTFSHGSHCLIITKKNEEPAHLGLIDSYLLGTVSAMLFGV